MGELTPCPPGKRRRVGEGRYGEILEGKQFTRQPHYEIPGEFIMVQKMFLGIKQRAETRISGFRNME